MTGAETTLLEKVYEQQLRSQADVASLRADVAALTARVDVQLAHGQQKMNDLRADVDSLKERIPERCTERLMSLESDRDKGRGSSSVMKFLVTAVIALVGGSVGTAAFALLSSLHK